MSEDVESTKTPSEELTGFIVATLSKEGLLHEDDVKGMTLAISSGKAKAEDWRVAIQRMIDREKEDE